MSFSRIYCHRAAGSVYKFNKKVTNNFYKTENFSTNTSRNMRFIQFISNEETCQHIGVQLEDNSDVIDLNKLDSSYPTTMIDFLHSGAANSIDDIKCKINNAVSIPLSSITILPPITKSDKVIGVGLNYRGHCAEQNKEPPKEPMFFSKFASCIISSTDNIEYPPITNELDWEVELAIIIGKTAKRVSKEKAMDYVFGFCSAQDISARDWQKKRNGGQFLLGKSMDTFCPLGPSIVHKSVVKNPQNLSLKCWVNGVLKQNGNTNDTIFNFDDCISRLSQNFTLYPGDVILTGTPAGVGAARSPPEFLKIGDVLETEVEGLGRLKNQIV